MAQFNLPPGLTASVLQPSFDLFAEACSDQVDRAGNAQVDCGRAEQKDWQPGSAAGVAACTYPARPVNGGSLERALPKSGAWHCEPKYNGWRSLVHAPTGIMFNRYGQRLSIQGEFSAALAALHKLRLASAAGMVEWFDGEALERRHGLGQGALLVFDYIVPGNRESYLDRKAKLTRVLPVHDYAVPPECNRAYAVNSPAPEKFTALEFYHRLKQLNQQWHCPFYEGVVTKRADSLYPLQLRSPTLEFAGWVKHRWAR